MHEDHAREIAAEWKSAHSGEAARLVSEMADFLVQTLAALPEDCAWCFGEPDAVGTRPVLLAQGKNLWRMSTTAGADPRAIDTEHFAVLSGFCHLGSSLTRDADGAWVRHYRLDVALPGASTDTVEFEGRDPSASGQSDRGESVARRLISAIRA
jgi:hypothetical protein